MYSQYMQPWAYWLMLDASIFVYFTVFLFPLWANDGLEVTFCTRVIVLNDCFQYCVPFELMIFKFSCKKKKRRKRETEKEREREAEGVSATSWRRSLQQIFHFLRQLKNYQERDRGVWNSRGTICKRRISDARRWNEAMCGHMCHHNICGAPRCQ